MFVKRETHEQFIKALGEYIAGQFIALFKWGCQFYRNISKFGYFKNLQIHNMYER